MTLWTVCSLPVSSLHGILWARILEWVVTPSSKGISQIQGSNSSLASPALGSGFFTIMTGCDIFCTSFNWKINVLLCDFFQNTYIFMVLMTRRQEGNVFLNSRAALMNRRFLPSIFWDTVDMSCHIYAQSCPILCDPVDCSPPGSSIHGILQARILEWVAISFSRGSSQPRDRTQVYHIAGRRFNLWATREAYSTV